MGKQVVICHKNNTTPAPESFGGRSWYLPQPGQLLGLSDQADWVAIQLRCLLYLPKCWRLQELSFELR